MSGSGTGKVIDFHDYTDNSKYFSTSAAQDGPEDLAQGYVYIDSEYRKVPYMNLTLTSGAGSVISNVLDYSKWLKVLISRAAPLSKAGHEAIRTPRSFDLHEGTPFTGPLAYTLGWDTGVYHGYEFFMHYGGMEAFGALVIFFPALKYGISSFGNTAVTANWVEEKLAWHLIDEKIGVPISDRFNWTKVYVASYQFIEAGADKTTQTGRSVNSRNRTPRKRNAALLSQSPLPTTPLNPPT